MDIGSVDYPAPTIKFKEEDNIHKFKSNSTEMSNLKSGSLKTSDGKKNKQQKKSTHFAEQSEIVHQESVAVVLVESPAKTPNPYDKENEVLRPLLRKYKNVEDNVLTLRIKDVDY